MAIDTTMDRLLDDWGWWVSHRDSGGYHCRSIEGRYRPPRVPGDEERNPIRMLDERACLNVERAVSHPEFPHLARVLLKGWYVLRISREKIAGKAGIPRSAFEDRLAWAVTMLRNRLDHATRAGLSSPPLRSISQPGLGDRGKGWL